MGLSAQCRRMVAGKVCRESTTIIRGPVTYTAESSLLTRCQYRNGAVMNSWHGAKDWVLCQRNRTVWASKVSNSTSRQAFRLASLPLSLKHKYAGLQCNEDGCDITEQPGTSSDEGYLGPNPLPVVDVLVAKELNQVLLFACEVHKQLVSITCRVRTYLQYACGRSSRAQRYIPADRSCCRPGTACQFPTRRSQSSLGVERWSRCHSSPGRECPSLTLLRRG